MKDIILFIVKNYFKDGFLLGAPQIIAIVVTLITLPIVLSNLSIQDYGRLQLVFAVQIWLVSVTAGHVTIGAQRGIARGLDGTFLFGFFSRLKFIIPVGLIALISVPVMYYIASPLFAYMIAVMGTYILVGYLPEVSYSSVFVAKKQFKEIAIWRSVSFIVLPLSTVLVAVLTHNILLFTIAHFGIITLISWAGFLYVIKKNNLFSSWRAGKIDKEPLSYGIKMIPADLISQTSQKITDFIIGPFFGFGSLAVFSIARNLEKKARSPMKMLHNLLYSDFSKEHRDGITQKVRSKLKELFFLSLIFAFVMAVIGYLYINLFLPESYREATVYFIILTLSLPAVLLQTILHTILATNLRSKELSVLIIISSISQIIFIGVLGFFFSIIGVTIGLVLGTWFSFALYYIATMKQLKMFKNDNERN